MLKMDIFLDSEAFSSKKKRKTKMSRENKYFIFETKKQNK
jgi:hypothetical protein